jgi:hypothetical protein
MTQNGTGHTIRVALLSPGAPSHPPADGINAARRRRAAASNRAALVGLLAERVPQPIDVFEIAAVVESMGITDPVAQERYGVETSFDLADRVYPLVLRRGAFRLGASLSAGDAADVPAPRGESAWRTSLRGLLALAPLVIVVTVAAALVQAGWSSSSVFAMAFGITAAVLVTSGPTLAINRRTGAYLGLGYSAPARRFNARSSLVTFGAAIVLAALLLGVLNATDLFAPKERAIFAAAFVAYTLIWLLVSSVTLAGSAALAVASLALGLAAGVATGVLSGDAVDPTSGLLVGYVVCVLALGACWAHVFLRGDRRTMRLPAPSLMALEATPYILFGSVFSVLFFEPHILGWLGASDMSRVSTIVMLELSLTLALPPVMFAIGILERTMHAFWRVATDHADRRDATDFRTALLTFHRRTLTRYALVLALLSCAMVAGVEIVVLFGGLAELSQLVFLFGIAGFLAFGIGQFNCLLMLNVHRPGLATVPMLGGLAVVTAVGVPLVLIDFRFAAISFALGAATFAVLAIVRCRRMLRSADHHYAAAL